MRDLIEWATTRIEKLGAQLEAAGPLWTAIVAVGVTLVAVLLLLLVRVVFMWLHRRLADLQGTLIRPLRYRGQEILSQQEIAFVLLGLLRLVRFAAYAVVAYIYLTFALGLFPATTGLADALLVYLVEILEQMITAARDFAPNLVFLLVLYFVTRGAIKLMRLIFQRLWTGRVTLRSFPREFAEPTYKIFRFLIIVFAIMVAYPYLPGAESPAFRAVSIFLGVLVSLGSSGAVANIISGITLTYMQAFKLGDRVKIADAVGDVVEKNTFVTRVRTIKNVDITIPNAMVLANHIINFSSRSRETGVILHTTVTIGYDVEWRKVHELLINAAQATEEIEEEPAPFVLQTSLDDFYVSYELNAHTRQPGKMARITSELHQHIQDGLHAAGIEIASPHLSSIRDGNGPDVPDQYLPQNYKRPAFRFLPVGSPQSNHGDG